MVPVLDHLRSALCLNLVKLRHDSIIVVLLQLTNNISSHVIAHKASLRLLCFCLFEFILCPVLYSSHQSNHPVKLSSIPLSKKRIWKAFMSRTSRFALNSEDPSIFDERDQTSRWHFNFSLHKIAKGMKKERKKERKEKEVSRELYR